MPPLGFAIDALLVVSGSGCENIARMICMSSVGIQSQTWCCLVVSYRATGVCTSCIHLLHFFLTGCNFAFDFFRPHVLKCTPFLSTLLLSLGRPGHEALLCVLLPWCGVFLMRGSRSKAHKKKATLAVSLCSIRKLHAISCTSQTNIFFLPNSSVRGSSWVRNEANHRTSSPADTTPNVQQAESWSELLHEANHIVSDVGCGCGAFTSTGTPLRSTARAVSFSNCTASR